MPRPIAKTTARVTAHHKLGEAIRDDQRRRWQRGERTPAERLLIENPAAGADPELALDLIYHEYLLRVELGETPNPAEYEARFPEHAARFRLQLEFDGALAPAEVHALALRCGDAGSGGVSEIAWPEVAGYEVLAMLGRGGMGVVYKARQIGLNRTVALKMILDGGQASTEQVARFHTEAEAIARLKHPHIVSIYEVGAEDGRPYLALELAEGGSLADRLDGKPWPVAAAARLVSTLARAVQHAHDRGIVHRDLKPENVLYDLDGIPKLTDFGLAKVVGGSTPRVVTASGSILGTPAYMAPEQGGLRGGPIGPAADVYALGAMLYELICGRPPFWGETPMATLQQVLFTEPLPPGRLRPGLAPDLESVVLKCLEKDPRRRYESAGALADDLGRFLAGEPVLNRPLGPAARLARRFRRRPGTAALAASLVLLAMGSVAGLAALWVRADRLGARAEAHLDLALETVDRLFDQHDRRLAAIPGLADHPGVLEARLGSLNDRVAALGAFRRERGDDPAILAALAESFSRIGLVIDRLARGESAAEPNRLAHELTGRLHAAEPESPRWRFELARCAGALATACDREGRDDEALAHAEEAEALWSGLVGDPAARAWAFERKLPPHAFVSGQAGALRHQAALLGRKGDAAGALARSEAAASLLESARRDHPQEPSLVRAEADARRELADHLRKADRRDEAGAELRRARDLFRDEVRHLEPVARADRRRVEAQSALGDALYALAGVEERLGRAEAAAEAAGRAVREQALAADRAPAVGLYRVRLANAQARLNKLNRGLGRAAEALAGARSMRGRAVTPLGKIRAARELVACTSKLDPAAAEAAAAEAVEALREGAAMNPSEFQKYFEDKDFRSIRGRADFALLVKSLESRAGSG